MKIFSSSC